MCNFWTYRYLLLVNDLWNVIKHVSKFSLGNFFFFFLNQYQWYFLIEEKKNKKNILSTSNSPSCFQFPLLSLKPLKQNKCFVRQDASLRKQTTLSVYLNRLRQQGQSYPRKSCFMCNPAGRKFSELNSLMLILHYLCCAVKKIYKNNNNNKKYL